MILKGMAEREVGRDNREGHAGLFSCSNLTLRSYPFLFSYSQKIILNSWK